jgi:fibronectin type 3 domain-containing protein
MPGLNMVGNIDRVGIYTEALTASQINKLYQTRSKFEEAVMPPSAPTGLSASQGDDTVELNWSDNSESDLDGYKIKRSTTSGGPYSTINTVSESRYSDSDVSPGTTYYYVVSANNAGGESSNSAEVTITTPDVTLPAPYSFYDFEEGSGSGTTVADQGAANNAGTLTGTDITFTTGGVTSSEAEGDGCVEITSNTVSDGTSYVEVPYAEFHNGDNYTFVAWVKWNTAITADWAYVFWQDGADARQNTRHVDLWWHLDNTDFATVLYDKDGNTVELAPANSGTNIFDGSWHQVAITLENNKTVKLYTDGVLTGEKTSSLDIAKTDESHNLQIGAMPGLNMVGNIDRVGIYTEALTASQISKLYQTRSKFEETPTALSTIESGSLTLYQNRPNPFNGITTIEYSLSTSGRVMLEVFDITGNVVEVLENRNAASGSHEVIWNGASFSKGVYFCRLTVTTDSGTETKVMKMIKL